MKYVWLVVMFIASWGIGVLGFTQILGSIQHARRRGAGVTIFTILLWLAILIGIAFLVHEKFREQIVAYYIGTGISLLQSLKELKRGIE